MDIDTAGNVVVTGYYRSASPVIKNSDGQSSGFTLPNNPGNSYLTCIIKYNSSGFVQWVSAISNGWGSDVVADSIGNIYVAGNMNPLNALIYNSNGQDSGITIPQNNNLLAFIVKYNSSGFAQWAAGIDITTTDEYGYALSLDNAGDVYLSGEITNFILGNSVSVYDAGFAVSQTVTINIEPSATSIYFVCKYTSSGVAQWSTSICSANPGTPFSNSVACDSTGNVYVCGTFYLTQALQIYDSNGQTSSVAARSSTEGQAIYLVKFNSNGIGQWASYVDSDPAQGISNEIGTRVIVDASNNVWIAGSTQETIEIYNSDSNVSPVTFSNVDNTYSSFLMIKFNSSGIAQSLMAITQTTYQYGALGSITLDNLGNLYAFLSYFDGSVIYNEDETVSTTVTLPAVAATQRAGALVKFSLV